MGLSRAAAALFDFDDAVYRRTRAKRTATSRR
jgi:hypothetical protein